MSDIHPHSRPDLDLLPCDCEPPPVRCVHVRPNPDGSMPRCDVCGPYRSLIGAVRDISAVRDLPVFVWDDLLAPKRDNLISLASERKKRQPLVRGAWSL